jgi:hypothetical protein
MDAFVYQAPKPTLKNRIQFISFYCVEGAYAGQQVDVCGDDLGKLAKFISRIARCGLSHGYTKCDVAISFDTGWTYNTRLDVDENHSTVHALFDAIDRDASYFTGNCPSHMEQHDYDAYTEFMNPKTILGFVKLMSTPQFNK